MSEYCLSDFDYALPPALIAQHPASVRSASRLLDGCSAAPVDRIFSSLPALLQAGDLLVFNDTQVIKARLFGSKASGGKLELLVERVLADGSVAAHMKVSKKPPPGSVLQMAGGFSATLLGRWPALHEATPSAAQASLFQLRFSGDAHALMQQHGHVPLPPYIERDLERDLERDPARLPGQANADESRYQTVFAKHPGAVAAPTAALHFDAGVLAALQARGVQTASVTLHVGAGTFQPVKTERIEEHQMHFERYQIPAATLQAIANCKARGGRVAAVGTTTVRTLESHALTGLAEGDTNIFIRPGFEFKVVDLLVTNFHLPKSSLMMLVSAFAGHAHIMALYRHAIAGQYRFFSYGDAMLLSKQPTAVGASARSLFA